MPLAKDLLHPTPEEERRRHKKKRLVQSPNSYFMDVKCPGCYKITTVFSHAQTVVLCVGCSTVLCQPTGGKARLTEGLCLSHKKNLKLQLTLFTLCPWPYQACILAESHHMLIIVLCCLFASLIGLTFTIFVSFVFIQLCSLTTVTSMHCS
uniref:40S ribosomal protein S27 n=1 Tax=Pygocentrus nattereri TaxID=42514 RepID=A0AAR2KY32_PYGNA